MNSNYLFPNYFKKPALVLFVLTLIITLFFGDLTSDIFKIQIGERLKDGILIPKYRDFGDTIEGFLLILSSLFIAFSKEKEEDEYLTKIRLESLVWATYINYGLLLVSIWIFYGFGFLDILVYNMFSLLIIFIIRFNFYKYKLQRSLKYEE